jgi:toxin-antitoxin system PIN domain toxin
VLLDANLLIYSTNRANPHYEVANRLVDEAMNGDRRVGIPWQTIGAFIRITTHPRVTARPLTSEQAWGLVQSWLEAPPTWIPPATEATARVYGDLASRLSITGNLVPDAMLAALAIEHGLELWSADTDFARFPGLRWRNPLNPN